MHILIHSIADDEKIYKFKVLKTIIDKYDLRNNSRNKYGILINNTKPEAQKEV